MTHEIRAGAEAEGGPERDDNLPDAASVPVHDDPADSDAPPIDDGELDNLPPLWPSEDLTPTFSDVEAAQGYPQWAGTERNEV